MTESVRVLKPGAGASSCPLGETGLGCRPAVSFFRREAKQFKDTGLPPCHSPWGLLGVSWGLLGGLWAASGRLLGPPVQLLGGPGEPKITNILNIAKTL